ncbi:MAG: hypothetical protein WC455_19280 [Dehalococcoidia bacterium]|jgi:hypothetical protein
MSFVMRPGKTVAGINIPDVKCAKCGGPVFEIPCKCPFKRKGWARCAKCLNPKCAHQQGLVKNKRGIPY